MRRDELIQFLEHIVKRQASHGIRDAFKFKGVLTSRKNGEIAAAKYQDRELNPAYTMPTDIVPGASVLSPASQQQVVPRDQDLNTAYTIGPGVTPASTPDLGQLGLGQGSAPPNRPRPKPRPTGRARDLGRTDNLHEDLSDNVPGQSVTPEYNTINDVRNEQPTLMLQQDWRWEEPQIHLDPSLDPHFDNRSAAINENIFGPWDPIGLPVSVRSGFPASVPPVTDTPRTPRRKGRNADTLAMEEAEKLLNEGNRNKRRR
jgi:hypothetical protein